jgi:hypothetical protein
MATTVVWSMTWAKRSKAILAIWARRGAIEVPSRAKTGERSGVKFENFERSGSELGTHRKDLVRR